MSLVATPHSHRRTGKRGFEDETDENSFHGSVHSPHHKHRRLVTNGRCSPQAWRPAYAPGPTTIAALRSLFPAMNEQTISEVLTDCGSDIDAAIKRLGQLQLRAEQNAGPSATEQPLPAAVSPASSAAVSPPASIAGNGEAPKDVAAEATAAAAQQQKQQQQPKTSAEWVDALVQTMSQAKDIPDARARAAQALQAFEQAIVSATQEKVSSQTQQLAALQRDNAILKRAVAIQNSRLQELAGRDAELESLKALAKQYHDRVQSLELSNYSLAQHLRQATDGRDLSAASRDPHVF